ncbi:MAG: GDSL-type esterase/lipase family protein, partial [Ruminococcus sp.]
YTAKDATEATPISGSQFILGDTGYYNKTDSQNNIQSDGTYVVSNEFHSGGGLTIQIQKNWWNNGSTSESSNRPDSIQVKIERMASNGTTWEAYPDGDTTYSLSPSSTGEWKLSLENVPKQSTEGGSIVTYIYRVTEVGYTINNVSHSIPGNQFATTSAGYYEISYGNLIDTSKLESNPTLSITNSYQPAETTKIIPQKVWVGDETHQDNRPEAIKLQLQRQSQNADGTWSSWDAVEGYDAIEISGTSDVSTWNGTLIDNLPKKAITVNADGTVTITNYQYRLIETAYQLKENSVDPGWHDVGNSIEFYANTRDTAGSYTITYGTAQDWEGKMAVTNTFKQDTGMTKSLVQKGETISPIIEVTDLNESIEDNPYAIKQKIGDKWYYIFNWVVYYKSAKEMGYTDYELLNDLLTPISDILPEGHTLVDERGNEIDSLNWTSEVGKSVKVSDPFTMRDWKYFEHPLYIWTKEENVGTLGGINGIKQTVSNPKDILVQGGNDGYFYDSSNRIIYFNQPNVNNADTHFYIVYATKIECDVLDAQIGEENYTFSNVIEKYDKATKEPNGETVQLDVTIKQPSDLVQKSYKETLLPGVVQFSLHLNPEGKNLSNGDTIDIEDLFKATGYIDSCTVTSGTKNVTDDNGKLVDVLMSNIKLYEVDVNGNKTLLPSSEYTMKFEGGDSVNGGAALLKLTIPDEKHIYIEYTYKLVANENTPSVKNGCWSSQLVNGMRVKMKPGMVPPAGDIIAFSNKAELKADSASGEDTAENSHYEISESGGTISTNQLPKIYKVNTGDYTINDLEATFYLAKYENGKWYYVTGVTQTNNKNQLTWGTTGYDGTIVDPNAYSITVKDAYEVQLSQNMLYKLVEVSVPTGYAGSNLFQNDSAAFREMLLQYLNQGNTKYNGVDYADFLSKYRHTNYFIYNSTTASYPEGFDARQVMQIKSGDNIEIPNNELIDIAVQKQWIGTATEAEQNDSSVTLELYWSYKKATTGIPDDATLVEPAELGIQVLEGTTFSATKTVPMTMLDGEQNIWTDLPNGLDDGTGNKPIYYYIKETAYTIGGKTYQLQADGTFKTEATEGQTAEIGSYVPIYVGNATNGDATITIKNTQKLMLQKEWKDANNLPLVDSKIPDKILVSIYGVNDQGAETKIFSNVELKKTENWTKDITSLLGTTTLNYKSYVAREEIPEGETAQLNRYVISCVFNLNANSGEITVTNKSNVPTTTSVEIQKQWSDGEEMHAADTIHVSLYRSTQKIPDADLKNLTTDILTQYGAVKMENPIGPAPEGETLPKYELDIGAADNWKYLWTNLPLEDDNTPANQYYYYVYEDLTQSNLPDTSKNPDGSSKYTPSYTIKSQTTGKTTYTISNYRNSIVAQKVWYDENGKQITNIYDEEGNLVTDNLSSLKEITLDVKRLDTLNIVAFGDSITDGYGECSRNEKSYPSKLTALLKEEGYKLDGDTVDNQGASGEQIGGSVNEGFRKRVEKIPTSADIICFLGGTNDIHQGGSSVRGDPEGVFERFEACISEIQTRTNNNAVIFVGSIPHFDFYKNGTLTEGGNWWNWLTGYSDNDGKIPNDLIDQYNEKIKAYAEMHDNVYFVDVCSIVTDDKIRADGCHPNEDGYTAIAQAYKKAISEHYTPNSSTSIGTIELNNTNNWMASYDIIGGNENDVYCVVEKIVPAGWEVSYTNNVQKAGSGTPIVVKNARNVPKTSLSVEKTWMN